MNKLSIISTVINLVAIALYVASLIVFASGADVAVGSTLVCGGSAFMGVGVYLSRKSRDDDGKGEDEDKKEEKK